VLGDKPKVKVQNRYGNILKAYRKYKANQETTGKGAVDKPEYFHEIDEIEGKSHATCPVASIDSRKL
jgi:hypothetical protein